VVSGIGVAGAAGTGVASGVAVAVGKGITFGASGVVGAVVSSWRLHEERQRAKVAVSPRKICFMIAISLLTLFLRA